MKKMSREKEASVHDMVLDEVLEELLAICAEYPLSIAKIAKLAGVSRQTVQRLFDRKPVHIRSLHMLKRWIETFEGEEDCKKSKE